MILEYQCNSCNQYFKIKTFAKDRGELNFYSRDIFEKCHFCQKKNKLDLNKIVAKEGKWVKYIYLLALAISLIGLYLMFHSISIESINLHLRRYSFVFGLILVIPFALGANLISSEKKAVRRFNQFYV